jgi:glycosyltransferase involved in cell wall biosynthesis
VSADQAARIQKEIMVSAIILTKNEAQDLPGCMESIAWIDDRIVVDSGSTDETVAIAEKHGARVFRNAFESFAQQRNWALDNCSPKYGWILFLDADERCTRVFENAVTAKINLAQPDVAGFYCCGKMMYEGVWLKRCDSFPKWQLRLVRRGRARFVDFGHGQKEGEVDGRLNYIYEPYLHFPMGKGIARWLERHERYAGQEAVARRVEKIDWKNIFSPNGSTRNRALKPLVSRIPGWPMLRFAWPYFFRLGFLEGRAGFRYCMHMARYERLIQTKMREMDQRTR